MARHHALALAAVLCTAAIAPPAEAGDAASVLLGIAAGVLVGTSSAPQPQQPQQQASQPQQSMRWIDQRCLSESNSVVCQSAALRNIAQHNRELQAAYLSRVSGPAAEQFMAQVRQGEAQYKAECDAAAAHLQACTVKWLGYFGQLYSARLAALSAPSSTSTSLISRPAAIPPNRNMRVTGEISRATVDQFDEILRQHPATNTVILDSPGGSVSAAADLAERIRNRGMTTVVEADAKCASACFILFAAGTQRIAGATARIGVHSASLDGEETSGSLGMSTLMARYCGLFGVPPAILGKMVTTTPETMTWLSAAELRSMQVEIE